MTPERREVKTSESTEIPQTISMSLYSTGWVPGFEEMRPDVTQAQKMADFFRDNYPEAHGEELKARDLPRYQTGEQIVEQIDDGNICLWQWMARISWG